MRKLKRQETTRLEKVHDAFRQGLELDGESEAAGIAFDAMHAFHLDRRSESVSRITKARELNPDAWSPLFEILTQS